MHVVASTTTTTEILMLKRQRPVTPPFDDPPSFLPDGPIRPLHPSYTVDPSQPRTKRQRIRPPPLDGALRGWLESEPAGPHWESDGEEDWTEDARDVLPPSTTVDQYKGANSLLHELHVLNQHRLLFVHSPRDRRLHPTLHTHTPSGERPATWTDASPYHPAPSQLAHESRCIGSTEEKGLVEEVHCVRQRYEDANRLLGSLFLSRRREVERMVSSTDPYPNS